MESPTQSERQQALGAVLNSRIFRRSDSLKRLLTYLVEQDNLGRGNSLGECEIAIQVLGRMKEFSPDTDSSVRTRMHTLRQKLDEYYHDEAAIGQLRITIPKGTYAPQFDPPKLNPVPDVLPIPKTVSQPVWLYVLVAFLVPCLAVWGMAAAGYLTTGSKWRLDRELREFWGPVLASTQPVAICVGQPVHLWVRDYGANPLPLTYPPFEDSPPASDAFLRFYREHSLLRADSRLVLHPSPNATLWGDSAGAALAGKFLANNGVTSELLPEGTLKSEVAIRGRALLIFGRPEFTALANRYLTAANGYQVGYLPAIRQHAIWRLADPGKYFLNTTTGAHQSNLGLITIQTEKTPGFQVHRTIIFNGITSDGSLAGIEYLTNSGSVADLRNRLRAEGVDEWPALLQVIVRTTSSDGYPLNVVHEKHAVLRR